MACKGALAPPAKARDLANGRHEFLRDRVELESLRVLKPERGCHQKVQAFDASLCLVQAGFEGACGLAKLVNGVGASQFCSEIPMVAPEPLLRALPDEREQRPSEALVVCLQRG